MRIFVTGGGGFIGSSLILALQDKHDIVSYGHGRSYSDLRKLVGKNVELIDGDITDKHSVKKAMKDSDVVIHLAGPAGNNFCMKEPAKATLTHAVGTHVVLKASIDNNVEKFLFSSTQSVYTTYKKRDIPFTEDMPLEPDDLYGALKAMAEYEIQDSSMNYVIMRFANVYGYGSGLFVTKTGGAIGNFIKAGMAGTDITLYDGGEQGIDYVHIADVSNAVMSIIDNKSLGKEILNVGSGELVTIKKLAETILDVSKDFVKIQAKIKSMPAPEGSIWPDRLLSIDKIKSRIGWEPSVAVEEGVREIFERTAG